MRAGRLARTCLALCIGVVALLATALLLPGVPRADAQPPQQVTFGLEGCRITAGTTLPINGAFVCPDSMYTSGALGANWSELDLVPYRLTADNNGPAQTYTVAVAGDYEEGGVRGFDAVSVPVLNKGLSDLTCQPPQVGSQQVRRPGEGGADASVFRNLTITQAAGEYCVYDYTLRLALGSADFSGSSLSGRFGSENFTGSQQNVGIQTGALEPQQLSKTIEAARGNGFLWTVNKSSVPSQLSVDTCLEDPTARFLSTITWTRTPVTGDVTWTSTVKATNPSNRALFIQVTDVVRADGSPVRTTTGDRVLLPAGAVNYPVLVHSGTAPAGTGTVSDTATATYIDTVTDQPIPQQTTATASAPLSTARPETVRRGSRMSRPAVGRPSPSIRPTRRPLLAALTSPSDSRSRPRSRGSPAPSPRVVRRPSGSPRISLTRSTAGSTSPTPRPSSPETAARRPRMRRSVSTETLPTPRSPSSRPSTFPRPRMWTSGSASGSRARIQQPIRRSSAGRSRFQRAAHRASPSPSTCALHRMDTSIARSRPPATSASATAWSHLSGCATRWRERWPMRACSAR